MSRIGIYIAITILALVIAITILPAHADLVPTTFGYPPGTGTNAPTSQPDNGYGPTQAQKDEALQIAAASPLCQQYNTYPDESWSCGWAGVETDSQGNVIAPDDGHTVNVFKELPDGSALYITVDLNTGKIIGQSDEQPTGQSTSTVSAYSPNTFSLIPPINTGNTLFNNLSSSPITDNSEVQPSTGSSGLVDNSFGTGDSLMTIPTTSSISDIGFPFSNMMSSFTNSNEQTAENEQAPYTPEALGFTTYF